VRYAIRSIFALCPVVAAVAVEATPVEAMQVAVVAGSGASERTHSWRGVPGRSVAPQSERQPEFGGCQKKSAAAPRLSEATVRARLAGVEVKASSKRPGWLALRTWREPELQLQDAGFQLVLVWNGLDDDKWPATRIAEVLAADVCGQIRQGAMETLLDRLYQSKSLVPEVDLGGNAGSSFKRRLEGELGACRVEILAEGARWHTLTIAVRR
jgi:hypothetical protein